MQRYKNTRTYAIRTGKNTPKVKKIDNFYTNYRLVFTKSKGIYELFTLIANCYAVNGLDGFLLFAQNYPKYSQKYSTFVLILKKR